MSCPARSPDLYWTRMGHDEAGTYISLEPATTTVELRQQVQDAWYNLSKDEFLHEKIHACVTSKGGTQYIKATFWAPLTVTCFLFGLNLLKYTPTMINYLSHHLSV